MLIVFALSILALAFTWWLAQWTLSQDEGPPQMRSVAKAIRDGAEGFLRVQYAAIFRIALVTSVFIFILYYVKAPPKNGGAAVTQSSLATLTAFTFLVGAALSGVAGYVGMWISVRANVRVAAAATRSYNDSICVALRGGAVCGLLVVGLCVLGLASLFSVYQSMFSELPPVFIPNLLVGFGFGASLVALFAQLGGGIYTKAADVGADLVGKVEQSIPEDDPRNPAVIADLVGDNVGDCAGRGADLFESISAEIIGAMILGGSLASEQGFDKETTQNFMMYPLLIHCFDLIVSSVGVMSVKVKKGGDLDLNKAMKTMDEESQYAGSALMGTEDQGGNSASALEDPLTVLKRGYAVALSLGAIGTVVAAHTLLHTEQYPDAWWKFLLCGLTGITNALVFLQLAQYYTDYVYAPVRRIASASTTGHGTNVIAGVAVGMESTAMPVLCVGVSILIAYHLGQNAIPGGGLFGTSVATMGMLSSAVYVLAMDTFGPIADNAGGIVEMSDQPELVRDITDRLDAVGNVTKAATKGYSIGSAGLACFLLFSAYMDVVSEQSGGIPFKSVDFAVPEVFVGGLFGGMLVYLFSSLAIASVGTTAHTVVKEVRRQFAERPGIMDGSEKPDYEACVAIVAAAALKEMKYPGGLALGFPIFCGFVFQQIGSLTDRPLLGPMVLAGFLMVATISGILLSLFLNNAGGAWDNAKKYVETGKFGGKGSETHKATVTGDTVGDPFKDTAGPSLHVLIKLLSTITLVLGPIFIAQV